MKSILVGPESKVSEIKYPWVGTTEAGNVVLFSSACNGTIVHSARGDYRAGHHSTGWRMDSFESLNGKVTLSN